MNVEHPIHIRVATVVIKLCDLLRFSVLYYSFIYHVDAQKTVAYICASLLKSYMAWSVQVCLLYKNSVSYRFIAV